MRLGVTNKHAKYFPSSNYVCTRSTTIIIHNLRTRLEHSIHQTSSSVLSQTHHQFHALEQFAQQELLDQFECNES